MLHKQVISALKNDNYEFSDLGDGTAVLTSLSDSKIISLNSFGSSIIGTLMNTPADEHTSALEALISQTAKQFDKEPESVRADVAGFLSGLRERLQPE